MRWLAFLLLALLVAAPAAAARDTLAPPGAPDQWLPREDWVYRHWLPFDAADATRELGLAPGQLEALHFDDRRRSCSSPAQRGSSPGRSVTGSSRPRSPASPIPSGSPRSVRGPGA